MLDQLWKRREKIRDSYDRWLSTDIETSEAEGSQPFVRIFLTPDLWRNKRIWSDLTTEDARTIFSGTGDHSSTFSVFPFNTVFKTAVGFTARQCQDNDPQNMSATWFLNKNLTSEIIVPVPLIACAVHDVKDNLAGYAFADEFAKALYNHRHTTPKIVDLNFLFSTLLGLFHIQSLLCDATKYAGPLFLKVELINFWRLRPYVDVRRVIAYQDEHGVPVCLRGNVFCPPGTDPDSFMEVPLLENSPARERKVWQATSTFTIIADALGLESIFYTPDGAMELIHSDLFEAGERALKAQAIRNQRSSPAW